MSIKIEITSGLSVTEAEAVIHLIRIMSGMPTQAVQSDSRYLVEPSSELRIGGETIEQSLAALATDPSLVRVDDEETEGEAPNAAAPELDSKGLPWDERIHASTKTTTADGTWKFKRGVDKALVVQVANELRAATGAVTPPPPPPAPTETVAAPPPPPPPAPVTETAAPPAPPAVETPTATPFVLLMKRITTMQGEGKLDIPTRDKLLGDLGFASVVALRGNDDAIAAMSDMLDAL